MSLAIPNQLEAMRDGLYEAGNTDAALLCDNAAMMITRLWTGLSECRFRLYFTRNHLAADKVIELEGDIIAMAKLLQLSNKPMDSNLGGFIMLNYDPFKSFGKGVRVGVVDYAVGDQELAANLSDLCNLHGTDYAEASRLEYPNGSIAMLNHKADGIGGALYLTESAYSVFMAWVGACHE